MKTRSKSRPPEIRSSQAVRSKAFSISLEKDGVFQLKALLRSTVVFMASTVA